MVAFATWIVSFFIVCIAGIFALAILIRILAAISDNGEVNPSQKNLHK